MNITTETIKKLREETGVSIMQCKKALEEAEGDLKQAAVILRKQAGAASAKKADRELGAGIVQAYIHSGGDVGSMVVLSCETDFVSKNEEFKKLAYDIAMHIAASDPLTIERSALTKEDQDTARVVFEKEAGEKPENMREKIIEGKLDSYFKDKVLLEQPFIKEPDRTIQDLVEIATQKFGERVKITDMARFSVRS